MEALETAASREVNLSAKCKHWVGISHMIDWQDDLDRGHMIALERMQS